MHTVVQVTQAAPRLSSSPWNAKELNFFCSTEDESDLDGCYG